MTTTQLIEGEGVFEQLGPQWDELVRGAMTDTPFQSVAYQRAWWRHLQPSDSKLRTVTVSDDMNGLVAIACFFLLDDVVFFNGCVEETDYLDIIVQERHAEMAWTAVLDCLNSSGFPGWRSMDLCNVPEASLSRRLLPELAQRHGLHFSEEVHEVCPVLELPDTFDEYLNSLTQKQRHEIRRKLRRAEGAGVSLWTVTPDDDIEMAVEQFLDLLQMSTLEKRDWLNAGRRAVFLETAKAALEAETLQLMFVQVDGNNAAALFNFAYNDRIWVYNSGLDPTAYGNLSLGVVLTALAIRAAIERGISTFDFLRGGETYKYRFGAKDTEVYRLQLARSG